MLAVVTNLPGWRVASPESDLEKAPDADWPLYPTTLPVLPVMFGPNITGQVNLCGAWGGVASAGALSKSGSSGAPTGGAANGTNVYFDASGSRSVYGSSSTVQPSSVRGLFCIKA